MRRRRRVTPRDDTASLLSSPRNAKLLRRAIADIDAGKVLPPPDRGRRQKRPETALESKP
jgi:hypothetical protein